jgi:hypothetical protein
MKDNGRALTINFMDGTKVSYGFPERGMNSAATRSSWCWPRACSPCS